MYAILSHGGRQYRVSAGDRLVVDRLDAEVGSVVALEPVLLTGGDGDTALGSDVDGVRVAVTVVSHLRGEKLRIFKYKAKKRYRRAAGHRSDLTELRVDSILARGAKLPSSAPRPAKAAAPATDEATAAPTVPAKRAPAKAASAKAAPAKAASTKAASTQAAPAKAAAEAGEAETKAPRRSTTKAASKPSGRAARKETGDGS
jgi:large subunit ribosomal protein L21